MNIKFGRELALLSLPLLAIGAATWWSQYGGRFKLPPDPLRTGSPYLKIGEVRAIPLNDCEIFEGFRSAFEVTTWQGGASPMSADAEGGLGSALVEELKLRYRQGNKWNTMALADDDEGVARVAEVSCEDRGGFVFKRRLSVKVSVNDVPKSADEVHLRGYFVNDNGSLNDIYSSGTSSSGVSYYQTRASFNFPVQAPGQLKPDSALPHKTTLRMVSAGWYQTAGFNWPVLRLRDISTFHETVQWEYFKVFAYSLKDGAGQEVRWANYGAETPPQSPTRLLAIPRDQLPPASDCLMLFVPTDYVPSQGWNKVRGPLQLSLKISDGHSWPLLVKAKVERQEGDFSTLIAQ